MFECQICGLLSLGGTSCPACGSQLRTDLSSSMEGDEVLPSEVPGLDDAAAAWYDLEGIEPPAEDQEADERTHAAPSQGGLPFGFQGESNVYASRLPFGIGSFAEGIPFEGDMATPAGLQSPTEPSTSPAPSEPVSSISIEDPEGKKGDDQAPLPPLQVPVVDEPSSDVPRPAVPDVPEVVSDDVLNTPFVEADVVPVVANPPPSPETTIQAAPVRLETARLVQAAPTTDHSAQPMEHATPVRDEPVVPDYWKIDAQIPNYEEIYDHTEEVVEMEYGSLAEDVVVFDHETDSPAAVFHSPLEATPISNAAPSLTLTLHPAQALNVDVGGSAELQGMVQQGFTFMQQGSWSEAARAFQRLAASLPSSPEVFNNYGISLLQRAMSMRDGADPEQHSLAEAQFESAILALREAAKGAPTNGDILVNLAIALIESGRSEKALGIMNVHNARHQGSGKGINTAAVAMFNLGQLSQATATLQKAVNDSVAAMNLQKLAPAANA